MLFEGHIRSALQAKIALPFRLCPWLYLKHCCYTKLLSLIVRETSELILKSTYQETISRFPRSWRDQKKKLFHHQHGGTRSWQPFKTVARPVVHSCENHFKSLAITQWRFPFWIFIINDWNLINIGIGSDIFNAKWRQMIKIKWEHFAKVSLPSLKIQMIRAPGIQLLPASHDSRILSDLVLAMQVADGLVLPHKTFWISAIF